RDCATSGTAALVNTGRFTDQIGRWRCLGYKAKGAVFENGDERWNDHASLASGALVVLLQERHHVDAVLAQCRANWWRWRSLAGGQLQSNNGLYLFSQRCLPLAVYRVQSSPHHEATGDRRRGP